MPFGARPAAPAAPPPAAVAAPPPAAAGFARGAPAPRAAMPPGRGAPPAARPPVPAGSSLWSGVQSQQDRDPMLGLGYYRVRVISNEVTVKPDHTKKKTFKATIQVVIVDGECVDRVGDTRVYLEGVSGDSAEYGLGRSKTYMMKAAGYEDDASFDAFDPEGLFINAIVGAANAFSEAFPANITGRLVDVRVTQGKPKLDKDTRQVVPGEFWSEHAWKVVPEEEQDTTFMPAWSAQ